MLWGDHGFHLGEKTWFGKTTLWEESAQTTFIIRTPEVASPGVFRRQMVSLMDVFPTLVSLTGVPYLDNLGGDDLSALLADPGADPVSTALTQMGTDDHSLRTERYRYLRFNKDPNDAELYDLLLDPEERTNLIDDPAYSGVRLEMETELEMALSERAVPTPTDPPPSSSR